MWFAVESCFLLLCKAKPTKVKFTDNNIIDNSNVTKTKCKEESRSGDDLVMKNCAGSKVNEELDLHCKREKTNGVR